MQNNFTELMESIIAIAPEELETLTEYPATERQSVEWTAFASTTNRSNNLSVTGLMEQVNVLAFERAFQALVHRHESLRTTYKFKDRNVIQVVHAAADSKLALDYTDLSQVPDAERKLGQLKENVLNTSFDLISGPVYQVCLVKMADQKYVYGFVVDHIAADSLSIEILKREFQNLYIAYASGNKTPALDPLIFQMKDYALWEQDINNSLIGQNNLAYWLEQLKAPLPVFDVRVPVNGDSLPAFFKAGKCTVFISNDIMEANREQFANPSVFITAVLNLWFSWLTQNNSVIVGMPVSTRESDKLNKVVGYLIAALYLKIDGSDEGSFSDLHQLIVEKYSEALAHRHYPRKGLPANIDNYCTAMLKVNLDMFKHSTYTGKLFTHEYLSNIPFYPVDCEIAAFKNGFTVSLHYNTSRFLNREVIDVFKRLPLLFKAVLEHPGQALLWFKRELSNALA
ncbi:condensation domain-containing protein [Mucilaginibacter rubeus]|uniref:Condensation domain-containing protein n=1 Tax=Mucilaginibacter rubeus TaxID=2027860 RepID=A0A5C1I517_9SPHI|nr:condensation domain-containing protein [Mucilaginibacter rubeus]QEM12498.1 hypothetical protein DEO27_021590 [Mucilaginibacter rubeus]